MLTALSTLGKLRGTRFFPLQEAEVSMIVVSAIPVLALGLLVLFAGIVLYRRLSKKEKQLDEAQHGNACLSVPCQAWVLTLAFLLSVDGANNRVVVGWKPCRSLMAWLGSRAPAQQFAFSVPAGLSLKEQQEIDRGVQSCLFSNARGAARVS